MSITTIGLDIGSGAVKSVLFRTHDDGRQEWLAKRCERIRSRDIMTLAQEGFEGVMKDAGLTRDDIDYIATTGVEPWVCRAGAALWVQDRPHAASGSREEREGRGGREVRHAELLRDGGRGPGHRRAQPAITRLDP